MLSIKDIEELNSKLLSVKAKDREEGLKLLGNFLDTSNASNFYQLLDQQTISHLHHERMLSSSWPGVLQSLCESVELEIKLSKKRGPKAMLMKVIRTFFKALRKCGRMSFLQRSMKKLFRHVSDVLMETPSFVSIYSYFLRNLLEVAEYRLCMSRKIYTNLLSFYLGKVKDSALMSEDVALSAGDEDVNNAWTLHYLLKYPPGDFTDQMRECIVSALCEVFPLIRDGWKPVKRLLAALNSFLENDGPNLGDYVIDIHRTINDFLNRTWLTTLDSDLKEALVVYARMQLILRKIIGCDDGIYIGQFLELVEKDLDKKAGASSGVHRFDGGKLGAVSKSMQSYLELAATLIYEDGVTIGPKNTVQVKKQKREHIFVAIMDRLGKGKILWDGAFCLLIRCHSSGIEKSILVDWLDCLTQNLDRILGEAVSTRAFEASLWTLRGLEELSAVWKLISFENTSKCKVHCSNDQVKRLWQSVWSSVIHWLPSFCAVQVMTEAAFKLLGYIVAQGLLPLYTIQNDFWDLSCFSDVSVRSILFFVAGLFSTPADKLDVGEGVEIRKKLMKRMMSAAYLQASVQQSSLLCSGNHSMLISAALLSLSTGSVPFSLGVAEEFCGGKTHLCSLVKALDDWAQPDELDKNLEVELEELDLSKLYFASFRVKEGKKGLFGQTNENSLLPFSVSHILLHELAEDLLSEVSFNVQNNQPQSSIQFFNMSALLLVCFSGVTQLLQRRGREHAMWSTEGRVWQGLLSILQSCISWVKNILTSFDDLQKENSPATFYQNLSESMIPVETTVRWLQSGCLSVVPLKSSSHLGNVDSYTVLLNDLLLSCSKVLKRVRELHEFAKMPSDHLISLSDEYSTSLSDLGSNRKLIDSELDVEIEKDLSHIGGMDDSGESSSYVITDLGGVSSSYQQWRLKMVRMIGSFAGQLPTQTCDVLVDLLAVVNDSKVQGEIFLQLCRSLTYQSQKHVPNVVKEVCQSFKANGIESDRHHTLNLVNAFLTAVLGIGKNSCHEKWSGSIEKADHWKPAEKELERLVKLVLEVAETGLMLWSSRRLLADVISKFILIDPDVSQNLIDKFLVLLHDPEYQVRLFLAKQVTILFQTWTGHDELFVDVCCNFGSPMVMATWKKLVTVSEISSTRKNMLPFAETSIVALGELAAYSEKIEEEAVFMMCAQAALHTNLRPLVCVTFDKLARKLKYPNRWKYLGIMLGAILSRWVKVGLPLPLLVEIREILAWKLEPVEFLQHCCPLLLPSLFLAEAEKDLMWLGKVASESVMMLVRQHFASVFAAILPLYCVGDVLEIQKAVAILQGSMLAKAEMTEDERDKLIKKHMVLIVNFIIQFCSSAENPQLPFFPQSVIIPAIRIVVEGFVDSEVSSEDQPIIDKMHIFRQDRIFLFILHLHFQIESAYNPRHLRHTLARLACLISVARQRIASPSVFRYLLHVIFQIMEWKELQIECCQMVGKILDILDALPEETKCCVLGVQLQFIISKLVGHCISAHEAGSDSNTHSFLSLIERLTLNADSCLHNFVKELTSFPDLMYFEHLRSFHEKLKPEMTVADEFVKLVSKASDMSHHLQLWSLKNLREKFDAYEIPDQLSKGSIYKGWNFSGNVVSAAWKFIQFCFEKNTTVDMCDISGDFISKVGIGDPYAVVFHLPDQDGIEAFSLLSSFKGWVRNVIVDMDIGVSEELVKNIILQLQRYLFDESVHIIELAFQTLKGILSTEKGNKAFLLLDANERDYLDLFSRRVNQKFVESFLSISRINCNEKSLQIADNSLWQTCGKSHDIWVCTLVSSLIHYSEDIILRLCQGLVSCKALLAEIILPHVLGDLAGRYGADSDICRSISLQVEKHIFCSRNNNTRSIQLFLDAINELRHCFVHARKKAPVDSTRKRESAKGGRLSSLGASKQITSVDTERLKSPQQEQTISKFEKQHCIRITWSKVYWLEIDYLIVAKAAQKCGAYFTSLLYVEHWCKERFGALTLGEPDFSNNEELSEHLELLLTICTRINEPDSIYGVMRSQKLISQILTSEHERNWTRAVESYDLLLRSGNLFSNSTLKEDSNPGNFMPGESCTSRHSIMQTDRKHLHWSYHKGMINSLQQSGFSHVLETYCKGLAADKVDIQKDVEFLELQYEAAWRAGKWDFHSSLSKESRNTSTISTFHSSLHSCLRSLHEGDGEHFLSRLKFAKQELLDSLAHTSLESTQNVYPSILKLQILNTLSKAWSIRWEERHKPALILHTTSQDQPYTKLCGPHTPSKEEVSYIDADWKHVLQPMACQYDLLEPYMAFRRVLLDALECRELKPWHLLEFTTLSRKAGRLNQGSMAIHEMKLIYSGRTGQGRGLDTESGKEHSVPTAARIEEAKILWAQGQHEMAVNLVKYIIHHHDNGVDLARLHCLTGKWLAENRSASSRIILEQYLKKAVELAGDENGLHSKLHNGKCQTYYRLAHYADSLYRSYEERLNSSEWQAALRLRQHKAKELESLIKRLKSGGKNDKIDYAAKAYELQKLLTMDNEEAQQLQDDRDSFLMTALDAYSSCLTSGQKYDLRVVFRITSLWFNLSSSQTVVAAMLKAVKQVQSFKFLPLVYQIASRLGSSKDMTGPQSFQYALNFLLKKMATEHPYHTLFQLLALANGDRVKDKQRNKNAFVADLDKKQAAEDLLKFIGPKYKQLVHQMKQMVEIYIKLAELEVKREDMNKRIPLPRDVRSIRRLELVPVVTASISVDPSCAYPEGWFPYFKGFSDRIVAMNGVNMPKDIECLGSDGKKYRQVAKSGNDDLRQDAVNTWKPWLHIVACGGSACGKFVEEVMEQLFGLVNTLLQEHPDTRKRCLNIRTYKVVPFTPSAGVIEWVSGTVTLGDYLVGSTRSGGAHGQYGHGDWSYLRCREYMINETDKRDAFQKVLNNFRPVMHNFFLENFAQPAEWFEKRLAYTRSVATSSMVGYIVGLGDRHSNNILIDQSNAELVHIDLGVAFEQGLVLKTPERVPFRLTRDVIDGMGVSGVEGVFRRCCEETLAVMRSNKEALLTIIEVFIHDPLYKWALSPLKALQRQKETNDIVEVAPESHTDSSDEIEGNKDAARALFRVKQKLDGYEGGDMRSIQGQVQQLIQDAQDPDKLCQMFPGWGSWL